MSRRARVLGAILIILVGLLNFHIPHFLIETASRSVPGSSVLEIVFLLNVVAALAAAVGVALNARWGWLLGILVVTLSFGLYVAQETVGLPGLPHVWLEPSRIVALVLDAGFGWLAGQRLIVVR